MSNGIPMNAARAPRRRESSLTVALFAARIARRLTVEEMAGLACMPVDLIRLGERYGESYEPEEFAALWHALTRRGTP
jgi:hypothetical protein